MIEPLIYCKVCGMVMQCIADFYKANGRRPTVLEIGCADGQGVGRYGGFCERVICVDPMVSGRPDIFSRDQDSNWPAEDFKLAEFKRRTSEFPVSLIIGCSLWPRVLEEVRTQLAGGSVDILVIDGCHHPFEAVWGDFEAYYQFVAKGGYIIFDDLYEPCILEAYERAMVDRKMVEHERWSVRKSNILQDVGALIKTED